MRRAPYFWLQKFLPTAYSRESIRQVQAEGHPSTLGVMDPQKHRRGKEGLINTTDRRRWRSCDNEVQPGVPDGIPEQEMDTKAGHWSDAEAACGPLNQMAAGLPLSAAPQWMHCEGGRGWQEGELGEGPQLGDTEGCQYPRNTASEGNTFSSSLKF